jgi:hypothetical protein
LGTAWPAMMLTSVGEPATTVASVTVELVRAEPSGAEALVRAAPAEFRASAETVALPPNAPPWYPPLAPPAELAVAETEPVVLDAAALELAVPPVPPPGGNSVPTPPLELAVELAVTEAEPVPLEAVALELAVPPAPPLLPENKCPSTLATPAPPWPPKDVASADASPELIDVVAVDVAAPPVRPAVGEPYIRIPEPPLPPVAVAQLDGSVVVVAVAVAAPHVLGVCGAVRARHTDTGGIGAHSARLEQHERQRRYKQQPQKRTTTIDFDHGLPPG